MTIAFAGDMALLGPAPSSLFSGVRGTLRRANIAIGNLEGTLSSGGTSKCGKHSTGCFAFQAPRRSFGTSIVRHVNALSRSDFGGSALLAASTGALRVG